MTNFLVFNPSEGVLEETEGFAASQFRENILLAGTYNGVNRIFSLPEAAVQDPPRAQVKVYAGGRRLNASEYEVYESVPASGNFDRVLLKEWAPGPTRSLVADYIAA